MSMGSALVIILIFVVISIILSGFTTLMISWLENRVPKSLVAAELDEKFFIKELFIEFVKAVDDNDVDKQEELKEIAYHRGIIVE